MDDRTNVYINPDAPELIRKILTETFPDAKHITEWEMHGKIVARALVDGVDIHDPTGELWEEDCRLMSGKGDPLPF